MRQGKLRKILWYIELVPKLGIWNVIYVFYYRFLMKSGIMSKRFPVSKSGIGREVFHRSPIRHDYPDEWRPQIFQQANNIVKGVIPYYSFHLIRQSVPPDWFLNPFNGKVHQGGDLPWSKIPDFAENVGDIKNIWEVSRFSWLGILARAYAISGDKVYLDTINNWIFDWSESNPVNAGPNWKCGQEASIRVINMLNAACILEQVNEPSESLREIIRLHLKRISANFRYAIAQRNNHATSEAAALFIGGSWLATVDSAQDKQYNIYAEKGRKALERLLRNLVYEDGSFAQHSVNYHRLFLDTLSIIIFWADNLGLQSFTTEFYEIARKSGDWLRSMLDKSGRCPNLGSNDGTMLIANHACDYLDYRPSLQLSSVLINKELAFESGPWDEALYWFGINRNNFSLVPVQKRSLIHPSGYIIMNGENCWALMRFPYYRFRPSHNDVFHFDLWSRGRNLLLDSGSFSYNPDKDCEVPDLKSVHAHNTLSFENAEQMPRLGRFLLAKWIKPSMTGNITPVGESAGSWMGSYRDASGNFHLREVKWDNQRWVIRDKFGGKSRTVQIGFNFNDNFSLDNNKNSLVLSWGEIIVSTNATLKVCNHWFSDYYMHSSGGFRLIAEADNNSEVVTTINILN